MHGTNGGPALNTIEFNPNTGLWEAKIVIDSRVDMNDYDKLLGHELNEIAGTVKVEHGNAMKFKDGDTSIDINQNIANQQNAYAFDNPHIKNSAAPDPLAGMTKDQIEQNLTAHDFAAMREFEQIAKDWDDIKATNPQASHGHLTDGSKDLARKNAFYNMIDEMGIKGTTDPRWLILKNNINLSDAAERDILAYIGAREMGAPFSFNTNHHLLTANTKNANAKDWPDWGIGGGHDEKALMALTNEMIDDGTGKMVPKFKFTAPTNVNPVKVVQTSKGPVTIKLWEQELYIPGTGYVKSNKPKTTFDNPELQLQFMKDAYENHFKAQFNNTPPTTGVPLVGTYLGVDIQAFLTNLSPLEFSTIFVDASTFK